MSEKTNFLKYLIVVVFLISLNTIVLYVGSYLRVYPYTSWNEVSIGKKNCHCIQNTREVEDEIEFKKARLYIEKYNNLSFFISIITALMGIALTIIMLIKKKKVLLHAIMTMIMILGAILMFFIK